MKDLTGRSDRITKCSFSREGINYSLKIVAHSTNITLSLYSFRRSHQCLSVSDYDPSPADRTPRVQTGTTLHQVMTTKHQVMSTKRQKMKRSSSSNHQDHQDNQYNDDDERKPAATGFVYYKVLVNDELSQASRVNVNIEDVVLVDTIKEAIKTRSSPEFDSVPIQRIELFESMGDIQQGNDPLDALEMWNSTVTWGTTAKPVIVQVPVNRNSESPRSNNNGEC